MKVWLVWTGQYSDAGVVGVYSTLALAEAAEKMHSDGWIDDTNGRVVDGDEPQLRKGIGRWFVQMDLNDGAVASARQDGVGTGTPPEARVSTQPRYAHSIGSTFAPPPMRIEQVQTLSVSCDARDKDHAVKIAGDERRKHLDSLPQPVT